MEKEIGKKNKANNSLKGFTTFITGFTFVLSMVLSNRWYSYFITIVSMFTVLFGSKYKIKKVTYFFICFLSIIIAYISMIFGRRDLSVSYSGNLMNNTLKKINHIYFKLKGEGLLYSILTKQSTPYEFGKWEVPEGYENNKIELSKSKGYFLTKNDSNHEKVIYQLHGGAYVCVFNDTYNETALKYSKCFDYADVFSVDYRTAPDNVYPCALEDTVEGYKWLLQNGYSAENIIVCGDSAGGGLALSLSFYLREANIALPKMLILCSPWTDFTAKGETYQTKILEDPFFGSPSIEAAPRYPVPVIYAGEEDLHNPYISPIYGDFKGLPPMLIQAGSNEILLSDSTTVVQKANSAGVKVSFKEYKGMFHTFYIVMPQLKESKEAWKKIEQFIEEYK